VTVARAEYKVRFKLKNWCTEYKIRPTLSVVTISTIKFDAHLFKLNGGNSEHRHNVGHELSSPKA